MQQIADYLSTQVDAKRAYDNVKRNKVVTDKVERALFLEMTRRGHKDFVLQK